MADAGGEGVGGHVVGLAVVGEGLGAELVGDAVDLCWGRYVSGWSSSLAPVERHRRGRQRTGKVAGGALAGAEALKGGLLDELGVLAALAVEVGQGTVGLHDGAGEALESALRDFAEHLELGSSKTDNRRNSEGEKLHVDGLMWCGVVWLCRVYVCWI